MAICSVSRIEVSVPSIETHPNADRSSVGLKNHVLLTAFGLALNASAVAGCEENAPPPAHLQSTSGRLEASPPGSSSEAGQEPAQDEQQFGEPTGSDEVPTGDGPPPPRPLAPDEIAAALDAILAEAGVERWEELPRHDRSKYDDVLAAVPTPTPSYVLDVPSQAQELAMAYSEFLATSENLSGEERAQFKSELYGTAPTDTAEVPIDFPDPQAP